MAEHTFGLPHHDETMVEEVDRLRRQNRILILEREISKLQQEIDKTLSDIGTSTPIQSDKKYVFKMIPPGRPDEGLFTIHKGPLKPRRLLPETPTSKDKGESLKPDRFVTVRIKKVAHPPKIEDKQTLDSSDGTKISSSSKTTLVKPATYDGTSAWTDYKAHFDACATLNGWDDNKKGLYLSLSLRGQAQGVFGNLNSKTTDYHELIKALEDRFSPRNQTELYRVQLRDRQQKATESMAELGQDIRRLTNLAYPNAPADVRETLGKEQFIDALVNSEMRLKIKQARPTDLNDAVRHAVELEAFYRAEKKEEGIFRSAVNEGQSKEIEDLKHVVLNLKHSVDSLIRQGQYNKTENRSMHRPYGYDRRRVQQGKYRQAPYHRSNDDRLKRRYHHSNSGVTNSPPKYRKREFHYNFKPGSSELRSEADKYRNDRRCNEPSMRKSGLYVTASIDRKSVDCLIDTGATLTLISDKLWSSIQHNHTLKEFDFQVSSTSVHYLKVKGQTELSILFGNNRYWRTTVIVAEIDMDVVLGLDFMRMYDVSIDIVQNTIQIRGQTFNLFCTGRIGCYQVGQPGQVDEPNKRRTRRRKRKVHTDSDSKVQNVDSLQNTDVCKDISMADKMKKRQLLPICPVCRTHIPEGIRFETHIVECSKKNDLERTCNICNKVMLKLAYLKKHMKMQHSKTIYEPYSSSIKFYVDDNG